MGGWKSKKTVGVKLDPATVRLAMSTFQNVLRGFNNYLDKNNLANVEGQRLVGSVSYYEKDLEERPDKIYGDIDYLVSFPFECEKDTSGAEKRKLQNKALRQYTNYWKDYLTSEMPPSVEVEDTLSSSPLLVIIQLPDGRHVQVDIIATFPEYCEWMGGRYTPERDRKGLIMGKMFKALGDMLTMTIGTEGVMVRTRNGKRVPSRFRKNVSIDTISTDIDNFLVDIAKHIVGEDDIELHPLLRENPGVSKDNVTLIGLARGIKGLGYTLAQYGEASSGQDFAKSVADLYEKGLKAELNHPKYKKASTPEHFAMIEKVTKQINSALNDANSVLRSSVNESAMYRQRLLRELVKFTLRQ